MTVNFAKESRKLADYIASMRQQIDCPQLPKQPSYDHICAVSSDIFLQAGVNYRTVVVPRVRKLLRNYSEVRTTTAFQERIAESSLSQILDWKHPTKLKRIESFLCFLKSNNIETCTELRIYLSKEGNRDLVLQLNGVGPKTLDYLLRLMAFDTIAVDRHIYAFVEMAGISVSGYQNTKKIVEHAADFLYVSRAGLDVGIWQFMSTRRPVLEKECIQMTCDF